MYQSSKETFSRSLVQANEAGDAAGNTSTTATMSVGETFDGSLSTNDHDWIAIDLQAGQSYVFSMWGIGGSAAGIDDTFLVLRDSSGTVIMGNNDVTSSNPFSQITYTATTTGTYYLEATAHFTAETGTYRVQAATDVFTVDQVVNQITEFGWGVPTTLHFDAAPGDTLTVNLTQLTTGGQQLARWALEAWSQATGLQFSEVSSGGNIRFDDNQPGSFAGPGSVNPNTGIISYSTVNISIDWLTAYGTTIDSWSFQTYVHEIGHALGLTHAGNYDGTATYGTDNHYRNDSTQMSVMSYFDPDQNTFVNGSYYTVLGPMIADIAALAALYGTNSTAYNGLKPWQANTVWGANSNVGGTLGTLFSYLFDGVSADPAVYNGGPVGMTVQDAGGHDLIDLSTLSYDQDISLVPGSASSAGGLSGNLVIGQGVVIEDLATGAGNDTLTGNAANNSLASGTGTDTLDGGAGYDRLIADATTMVGLTSLGGGSYRISYTNGDTDTFSNIQLLTIAGNTVSLADMLGAGHGGTDGNATLRDVLTGTSGDDWINGLGGNDRLDGGAGNDLLSGGDGNDELLGRAGNDVISGGAGNDNIAASDGDDVVYGGDGHDAMGGGYGNDRMFGEDGNDVIGSGSGRDYIDAGNGDDVASGGWGYDEVHGGAGGDTLAGSYDADRVYGEDGDDSLGGGTGDDYLDAGAGNDLIGAGADNDELHGGTGNDFLGGGAGNDLLYGEDGSDKLNGGSGDDTLYGGAGADQFVFTQMTSGERDVIADFQDGIDTIRMHGIASGTQQQRFDALSISAVSGGVDISYGGHVIHVDGAAVSDFSTADFILL